uniref:DNA-directed DNA polymerase n=1 Tax=Tanacetum cinerariifolium TaxID=118510 RepID=A0A699I382_TANCI|nr:DNA-directed DNA polymerase [Tanacetum cinerariifolium]
MEKDYKPAVQHQRRVNPKIHDVIKKEVEKLLDAGLIYPISNSPWVSPVHCVPKKGGFTVIENEENKLIPTRLVTGRRVCIDYRKLNEATCKDHFPFPFIDQMLERSAGNEYYCFLDGFSGYFQIPIDPRDQEKTTYMLAIFYDMVEKMMEVFIDDFSVFGNSFENYLSRLDKMLQRHKISKNGIEVDKAKVDVIAKLPHPTTVKEKLTEAPILIAPNWDLPFELMCDASDFAVVKEKLTEAPILIALNWDLPFELMCDASDFSVGAVLGQRHEKHIKPIHYASKTMNDAESNYTTTEKEMLAIVYAFEKFQSYLIMNKSIVHTDHSALKYLFAKKDAKARLLRAPWFADFVNYHAGENRASWSDKLDYALWAFRTAYKTPIGCTPYKLVYGKACHLTIELEHKAYWALKQADFDLTVTGDHRKVQLNELNELRDHAYENSLIYKEKTNRIHDSKIKNRVFNNGDRVLFFNSRLKIFLGKLKTRWSGPFTITKVFPYGTVKLSQTNGPNFKVNVHRVKHYFGGDVPQLVVPDLQTFPMDN